MHYTDQYTKLDAFSKAMIWLTGAEPEILKKIPSGELQVFTMLGASLLVPAFVASLTLPYFFSEFQILEGNGFVFGVLCFLLILTLERLLIRGMGKKPVVGRASFSFGAGLGMLIRILLALVMGALVSIPLEHKVFEQDINEYLTSKQLASTVELERAYKAERDELYDHYNPMIEKLDAEYTKLNDRYLRELDGSGGTERRGNGSIARAKKAVCDSIAAKRKMIADELEAKVQELDKVHSDKLERLEKSFSTGIIARHEALWQLTKDKWSVLLIVILLKLFFLLLDVTPIIAKQLNHTKYYDTYEMVMEQAFKNSLTSEIQLETDRRSAHLMTEKEMQEQFKMEAKEEAIQAFEIQFAKQRSELTRLELQSIREGQQQIATDIENHLLWLNTLADDYIEDAFKQEIQDFLDMQYKRKKALIQQP
jgi:hypothetical protein